MPSLYEMMNEIFNDRETSVGDARKAISHSEGGIGAMTSIARSMKNYRGMFEKADFVCKQHGAFQATPVWVATRGCPECALHFFTHRGKGYFTDYHLEDPDSEEDEVWLKRVLGK